MSVESPVIDYIDNINKLIYLREGITEYHPVTDIYVEVRNLRRLNEELRKFDVPVTAAGNVPKGGGKYTPRYAIFNHGYKVVPWNETHSLYISGEQITDDGQSGPACINTEILSEGVNVIIHYEPPAAEIVRSELELASIQQMAYNNKVIVDNTSPYNDMIFPSGTTIRPINSCQTAAMIAFSRGFTELQFITDHTVPENAILQHFTFSGLRMQNTTLTFTQGAQLIECSLQYLTIQGRVFGVNYIYSCKIGDFGCISETPIEGDMIIKECLIEGPLTIPPTFNGKLNILNCWASPENAFGVIDMDGCTGDLIIRAFSGDIQIINNSENNKIVIDMISGKLHLDESITGGNFVLRGVGTIINNTTSVDSLDTTGVISGQDFIKIERKIEEI